jgi:DNA-binding ferritin-like protein
MEQELREKQLRQQIHAIRVKKFHWPLDGFKFIMNGLGFGESLSALHDQVPQAWQTIGIQLR